MITAGWFLLRAPRFLVLTRPCPSPAQSELLAVFFPPTSTFQPASVALATCLWCWVTALGAGFSHAYSPNVLISESSNTILRPAIVYWALLRLYSNPARYKLPFILWRRARSSEVEWLAQGYSVAELEFEFRSVSLPVKPLQCYPASLTSWLIHSYRPSLQHEILISCFNTTANHGISWMLGSAILPFSEWW